jgi:DNA-3-methyladenine glycosylase
MKGRPGRDVFLASSLEVAPKLLGAVLRHETDEGVVAVRITEVEAYIGDGLDPGSHAFRYVVVSDATNAAT